MDHHAVKLFVEICLELLSIFPYTVHADENIAGHPCFIRVIESDDVCISVVGQVLNIKCLEIFVGAKNEVDACCFVPFRFYRIENPLGGLSWMGQLETNVFLKELYKGHLGIHVEAELDYPTIFLEVDFI